MSIHNSTQICGEDHKIEVERNIGSVWVRVKDANGYITMNAPHVRAMAAALDDFEAGERRANLVAAE